MIKRKINWVSDAQLDRKNVSLKTRRATWKYSQGFRNENVSRDKVMEARKPRRFCYRVQSVWFVCKSYYGTGTLTLEAGYEITCLHSEPVSPSYLAQFGRPHKRKWRSNISRLIIILKRHQRRFFEDRLAEGLCSWRYL